MRTTLVTLNRQMLPKRFVDQLAERPFTSRRVQGIKPAKQFRVCNAWPLAGVLSIWLVACNNQHPAAHGLPLPEVTVSRAVQKEVVNWDEFTGRTAAVALVTVTPRVSGYIV